VIWRRLVGDIFGDGPTVVDAWWFEGGLMWSSGSLVIVWRRPEGGLMVVWW
jgi:hypothetical protein